MTRAQLLSITKGTPFHPFEVRTSSGASYRVAHPEQYWVSPKGETILIYTPKVIVFVDAPHVTEFVRIVGKPPGKSKRGAEPET